MSQVPAQREDPPPADEPAANARGRHQRRPPLAEIDTWELWQAWKRGERGTVMPWIGLMLGFCFVLAAMYSFFFFSTSLTGDTFAMAILGVVLLAFLFFIWRRISTRSGFAFAVMLLIALVSALAFALWLAVCALSGWNALVGVAGTVLLGIGGLLIGLRSLNAIAARQETPGQ